MPLHLCVVENFPQFFDFRVSHGSSSIILLIALAAVAGVVVSHLPAALLVQAITTKAANHVLTVSAIAAAGNNALIAQINNIGLTDAMTTIITTFAIVFSRSLALVRVF
jgi:hypothetical protein